MKNIQNLFKKPGKSKGGSVIEKYTPNGSLGNLGFSSAAKEWQELRHAHYLMWLGSSQEVSVWHEVVPIIPHIDIHVFSPSKDLGRNYYTLITSGMSDERMALPEGIDPQYARAELIFYVADAEVKAYQTEKPWLVDAIYFFAHFPFNYKTWLAFSHTIPNGNPPSPVVPGSLLTTAIFLPAIFEPPEFRNFKLGDESINFLWLSYLSDKETEYKLDQGYDKLVEKFNKDNFPQVFNPFRQSVI